MHRIITFIVSKSGIEEKITTELCGGDAYRPLGYEKVYLRLYKVADTPFHIQGVDCRSLTYLAIANYGWEPFHEAAPSFW